jgi:hypothetical protein
MVRQLNASSSSSYRDGDLETFRNLEGLKSLKQLSIVENLDNFDNFCNFEHAEDLENIEHLGQGLTFVHCSAQPEPYLTRNTPFKPSTPPNTPRHLLNTRKITLKQTLNAPPIPKKALTLS